MYFIIPAKSIGNYLGLYAALQKMKCELPEFSVLKSALYFDLNINF